MFSLSPHQAWARLIYECQLSSFAGPRDSPGPHEGMIVGVERGEMLEHVIVRAHALLALLRVRAVVPGIVDHHPNKKYF